MTVLNVTVENKIATADNQIIVCDNTDYIVQFTLDEEWDDYDAKTMRILYSTGTYEDIVFTGTSCPLPRIYNAAAIGIGIYAGDLHATVAAVFNCKRSVLSEDGTPVDPPEDVYNQIMEDINNGMLKGDTGNGIESIVLTSTSGNVDTYTITYTDGDTTTFTVTNGAVTSVDGLTGAVELDYKANIDGAYENMTVGNAEQLVATQSIEDKAPYVFRTSGGSNDIGNREEKTIVGASVVWNQLVNTTDTSVTVPSGHKYYSRINSVDAIGVSTGTAITINDGTKDNVFDLTTTFSSVIADRAYTLEQSTAGSGVAWLKSYGFFTKPYYAYTASPSLQGVKTSAHETVGFNQFDKSTVTSDKIIGKNGSETNKTGYSHSDYIQVVPNTVYYVKGTVGTNVWNVVCFDGGKNPLNEAFLPASGNNVFTTPTNCGYIVVNVDNTQLDDICINLSWSGTHNGEYEAYNKHTYALDDDLTLNGILKLDSNNEIYADGDTYEADGTVTRYYEKRAYASGDESLANAITDGTNTVVKLTTPTTTTADPYQTPMIVDDWGTERFVDAEYEANNRDFEMPVGHITIYPSNLRDKVQHLPELAEDDGDYIIRQTGTGMALVAHENELPSAPSEDGTYTLKVTVADGVATYSWEA